MDEESYNFAIVLKYSAYTGIIGNEIDYTNRISTISKRFPIWNYRTYRDNLWFKNSSQLILERNDLLSYQSWDEGLIKNTYKSEYDMYSDYVSVQ